MELAVHPHPRVAVLGELLERLPYSPFRPRTTGASTMKRVFSGNSRTFSTICCGVEDETGKPQT